ncbi:hypothetical protein MKW98_011596, partial [Papaver atlanticum]
SHQKFTSQISPRGITGMGKPKVTAMEKNKTSKETLKMKVIKKFAIKMKNKQKTQQSPTDKASPSENLQEEEEQEKENLRTRKAVEEDNSNHVEPDVEEENDNGDDDEPELDNGNSSDNEEGEEGKEAKKKKVVPHQAKENIWKIVTNRFIVPEYYKDYYFSKMGSYLREARSRKPGLVLDALDRLQGEEREKRLDKLMPRTMTVREWEDFVKYVNSAKFRVKRLKMQEVDLQKDQDTTEEIDRVDLWKVGQKQRKGKKPHPGEKLKKAQAEHGADCGSPVTDDILAKAFGEDKKTKGRLKKIGFGATRKKLDGRSSKCVCNGVSPSHRSSPKASNNQEASTSRIVRYNERDTTHTTLSPLRRPNEVQVPERFQACELLSWYKEGEVVAEAKIGETNPQMQIHGLPIGLVAYTVCVMTAYVEDAHVYRPTSEIKYVGEAVGNFITWSKDRISY